MYLSSPRLPVPTLLVRMAPSYARRVLDPIYYHRRVAFCSSSTIARLPFTRLVDGIVPPPPPEYDCGMAAFHYTCMAPFN